MQIKNKVALVTGAARGIGSAFAKELLRNGARHVAILDVNQSTGEEIAEKLNSEFGTGRTIFIHCDVTKPQQFEDAFKKTVKTFGGLDIVINNAAIANETAYDRTIGVNVTGMVRGTFLGFQYMGRDKGAKGGVIVNLSSIWGLEPAEISPVYSATKHAVIGLSQSLATPFHFARTGVQVFVLCPGGTATEMLVEGNNTGLTDDISLEYIAKICSKMQIQMVDNVAHGLIHVIKTAPNGSIWIVENDEPVYEVRIPNHETLKVKADE